MWINRNLHGDHNTHQAACSAKQDTVVTGAAVQFASRGPLGNNAVEPVHARAALSCYISIYHFIFCGRRGGASHNVELDTAS